MKKLLLFDMDGVLLKPRGYHLALQETVARIGSLLGYQGAALSEESIAALEAIGVSSEWDSAAICAAWFLRALWQRQPEAVLPKTLSAPLRRHDLPLPSCEPLIAHLGEAALRHLPPLRRTERILIRSSDTPRQQSVLRQILRRARQIDGSLTHRLFQELVLGSQTFAQTYHLPPYLNTVSYLRRYDEGALSAEEQQRLKNWVSRQGQQAAIFTNRPNRPPEDLFGTPEAEIGAQTAGVDGLPIVGWGDMTWLAQRRGADPQTLIKPSALHALTALLRALGVPRQEALLTAAAFVLDGKPAPALQPLHKAEIYAFEDTAAGLKSVLAAQKRLHQAGIWLHVHLFGISDSAAKRRALTENMADTGLYASLPKALEPVLAS